MGLNVNLYIKKQILFIKLKGEMDQLTSDELRLRLNEIIVKYNIKNLVFNMRDVTFIDSSGIGIIIGRYNQLKLIGGKIYLCELNETIERIILLSGLNRICTIKDTEEAVRWNLEMA